MAYDEFRIGIAEQGSPQSVIQTYCRTRNDNEMSALAPVNQQLNEHYPETTLELEKSLFSKFCRKTVYKFNFSI